MANVVEWIGRRVDYRPTAAEGNSGPDIRDIKAVGNE